MRNASGVIRMTCPEPLVNRITRSGLLDRFHARHPAFRVEFVMSDKYLDLRQGDADVALRSGDTEDGALVGRKLGDSLWAVYASQAYVAQHGQPARIEDIAKHPLVGFDETMANHRAASWLREVAPQGHIVARNDSVLGLLLSVKPASASRRCPRRWAMPSPTWCGCSARCQRSRGSGACWRCPRCAARRACRRCSTSWWKKSTRCDRSSPGRAGAGWHGVCDALLFAAHRPV